MYTLILSCMSMLEAPLKLSFWNHQTAPVALHSIVSAPSHLLPFKDFLNIGGTESHREP